MKKNIIVLILVSVGFFSCNQTSKSTPENGGEDTFELIKDQQKSANTDKGVYTKYEYTNSKGAKLTIQNSFPKGGIKYTDPKGHKYIYAVFWTRIINETDNPIELKIDFPVDSYEIPALPGKYYKTLIPSDTMKIQKIPLFNYGLTNLEPFLDKNIDKPSSLKRAVKPKESTGFYVVTLRLIGGGDKYGVLRTKLSLKGQKLFYKIRDKEIECGSIEIK
ncbi:hypothetical protein [Flavobacterium ginsenosidimutans]|uniref:Lipoprotein n=1 Tax=Flavobacterium ginsenosidimutans TaxID=687844 RepID=A0ABZ2Q2Z4_9FLAO|nr:hypothetical protein [Flavobacterium ginsenosidimutans]KAF2339651.1 hypothetical protein DM444_00220 [Flavobacterium ginsenosidimutans]